MSDQEQEEATIVVLRTSDAKRVEIKMSLAASLNNLKGLISAHDDLGPLLKKNQRIFHLGRELKTAGGSLEGLGVGRFQCFTVHLLAKGSVVAPEKVASGRRATKKNNGNSNTDNEILTLDDSSDDDDDAIIEVVGTKRRRQQSGSSSSEDANLAVLAHVEGHERLVAQERGEQLVIELGGSSEDDDDDDDDDNVAQVVVNRKPSSFVQLNHD